MRGYVLLITIMEVTMHNTYRNICSTIIVSLFLFFFQGVPKKQVPFDFVLNKNLTNCETTPFTSGALMDIAAKGSSIYLLVQNYRSVGDVIFCINRFSGKREGAFNIGKHNATAINTSGNHIWILSRSLDHFLRKVTFSGNPVQTIAVTSKPSGAHYGLAIKGNNFFISSTENNKSKVYKFDGSNTFQEIFNTEEKIYSLLYYKKKLYAYQNNFHKYANHWLIIYDLNKKKKTKKHFLNSRAWGLATDGETMYAMARRISGGKTTAIIYTFTVGKNKNSNIVFGRHVKKRITLTYLIKNENSNPFKIDLWIPYPSNRKFQKIYNVMVKTTPNASRAIEQDAFGNKWIHMHWTRLKTGAKAVVKFDIQRVSAAYTLKIPYLRNYRYPRTITHLYTKPTACFDYLNPPIPKTKGIFKNKKLLSKIISIRDYVNDKITVHGATGPQTQASYFFSKGKGRCYAHTLCFAAIARMMKIPTRAIGGIMINRRHGRSGKVTYVHTWNQVYLPNIGWIDIDSVSDDDDTDNNHTFNYFGYHSSGCYLTFEGNYDELNYGKNYNISKDKVFTKRGWWNNEYYWSSRDPNNKASKVKVGTKIKID
jgi:transglutaminase-like putative cysteine protease